MTDQQQTSEQPSPSPKAPELTSEQAAALRRHERRIWIGVAIGCVVALGLFAWLGSFMVSKRMEAARGVDRAASLIQKADATVLAIDEVVRSEVSADIAEKAKSLSSKLGATKGQLDDAVAQIDAAMPRLTDDEQKRARLLRDAAKARLEMLAVAGDILDANVKAGTALPKAGDAWQRTIAGDEYSDAAVKSYNLLTKDGVTKSASQNVLAETEFRAAKDLMSQAASAFPEADFSAYVGYIDQRLAAVAISKQSDAAWLAGDAAKANALIASYNAADAKAVELAKGLASSPTVVVADAYKALADAKTTEYYTARQKATDADAAIKGM